MTPVGDVTDEACGIMLLLSATAGIERIKITRTERDSNVRLNLFMHNQPLQPTPSRYRY